MPHSADTPSAVDSGIQCLVLLARYHQLAADAQQLRHQFGKDAKALDTTELLLAAKYLKLKARHIKVVDKDKLTTLPLPAMARHRDGHYFVVAKVEDNEVLVHDPLEKRPQSLHKAMFMQSWDGEVILLTKRAILPGIKRKFDISWFVPAILKYRKHLGEVLLASFFLQLFALITPLFFQVVIDKVLAHGSHTTLEVLAIGLLAISAFDVLLSGLRAWLLSHTTNRVDVSLGARLFKHLLSLPIHYFKQRRVGDTVARVRELETIRQFITGSSLTLVIDLFFTLVFFTVMALYSPTLTWIVVASIPFYIGLSVFITPLLRKRLQEKFQRGAENQAFLVESVSGMETLKSMAVEPQMQRHWEDQLACYVSTSFRSTNLNNIANQIAAWINKVVTVLILWIGASLVIQGALSVGQLIAFNMLAARVSAPILRLVQLWQDFQQAGISVERLGDILNSPTEPGHDPNRTTLPELQGDIRFEQVSFRYDPQRPQALKNIDFEVAAGEIIGVVGRSGSGKSSLTKLLQRLYVPETGRVLIDGVDIALVQPMWLRRQIGVVLQESFLFNRSIKDNIALADPGTPIQQVIMAARLAGAHEFITELPEAYDTVVGEQASILSGGQKQRIAIARALINDPRILIFDEATSALDYESEQVIQNNMPIICKGRTVFIIAHRLSTIRQADRVLVLEEGQIIESGTQQKLVNNGGLYARLHSHQIGQKIA